MRRDLTGGMSTDDKLTFKGERIRQFSQKIRTDLFKLALSSREIGDSMQKESIEFNTQEIIDKIISNIKHLEVISNQLIELFRLDSLYDLGLKKLAAEQQIEGLGAGAERYLNYFSQIEIILPELGELAICQPASSTRRNHQKIFRDSQFRGKIDNYIEKYIDKKITVEKLAASLYMDRSSFTRKVKSITALNTQQYILHYRLAKAYEYLPNAQSVGEIANILGFSTQNHLSTSFSKLFGITCKERMLGKRSPRQNVLINCTSQLDKR
ncbi:helix-turn-helix domain-containing protein [Rheinheimera gaetbuli]